MLTLKYTDYLWLSLGIGNLEEVCNVKFKELIALSQEDWLYNLSWTAQHLLYNMEYYLCLTYTHPFSTLNLPIAYMHNAM